MTAKSSMVDVTPADLALNLWVLRLIAPKHIDNPGRKRIPAKMLPIILPSTNEPLPLLSATQYRKTSTRVEKKALIAAPRPIEDCAEMDATAWPMKYASGMIENNAAMNRNASPVMKRCSKPSNSLRMK